MCSLSQLHNLKTTKITGIPNNTSFKANHKYRLRSYVNTKLVRRKCSIYHIEGAKLKVNFRSLLLVTSTHEYKIVCNIVEFKVGYASSFLPSKRRVFLPCRWPTLCFGVISFFSFPFIFNTYQAET